MSRLDEIQARVDTATAGVWDWKGYGAPDPEFCERCEAYEVDRVSVGDDIDILRTGYIGEDPVVKINGADYLLLRHAREDVPYLLARVRELETALEKFGQHVPGCPLFASFGSNDRTCGCGLAEILGVFQTVF